MLSCFGQHVESGSLEARTFRGFDPIIAYFLEGLYVPIVSSTPYTIHV